MNFIILHFFIMMIISNYNTSATPWKSNQPNTFDAYSSDDFKLKNETQLLSERIVFRPKIRTSQINDIDYSEQIENDMDIGNRTSLRTPGSCPKGKVYSNGKCRTKWNRFG